MEMEKIRMIVKSKYEEETLQYSHLANNKKKKREKEKKVYENNPYPPCFLPGFDLRISLGSKWNSELADDGLHEQIEGEAVAESELVTKDVEVLLLFFIYSDCYRFHTKSVAVCNANSIEKTQMCPKGVENLKFVIFQISCVITASDLLYVSSSL